MHAWWWTEKRIGAEAHHSWIFSFFFDPEFRPSENRHRADPSESEFIGVWRCPADRSQAHFNLGVYIYRKGEDNMTQSPPNPLSTTGIFGRLITVFTPEA
jgi:hypothetical protein